MTAFGKRIEAVGEFIAVNTVGYVGGRSLLLPLVWWATRTFRLSHDQLGAWAACSIWARSPPCSAT